VFNDAVSVCITRSSATQDMQCMLVTGPGSILMGGHQPLVVELDIESHTEIRQVTCGTGHSNSYRSQVLENLR